MLSTPIVPLTPHIAVVGGGISGLAAAWRLRERGAAVTLFEAQGETGGVIRSVHRDGFLVDEGPNTLVARSQRVVNTLAALGLDEQQVWASEAAKARYVVRGGRLVPVPTSPRSFATTPLLSARAKLRLLAEPFVRAGTDEDESLASFVRRRLGAEVLDYAVNPFVAGVWAAAPERLAVRHAFPALHAMERERGSLARGLVHRMRTRPPGPRLSARPFSFAGGAQALPDAFAHRLGDAVRLQTSVTGLERTGEGWTLTTRADGGEREGRFDGVVWAAPLDRLPEIEAGRAVPPVSHSAVSVLALGFRRADVAHPLDGFGVLIPEREPFRLLGALFSSTLFSNRAPEGHVLLTCFAGGTRHAADALLPTDDLVALALRDLGTLLGVRGDPVFVHRKRWDRAIPQYDTDYDRVLGTLSHLEAANPGLHFAGNTRGGISVGDALETGLEAADRLAGAG
ncbi:MAG: protoporphyrinogen oxidase [Bacteroidota bacterium]